MAIRLRVIDGITIALCAAETDPMAGDIYLDDAQHYALAAKFCQDHKTGTQYPREWALMETQKIRDAETELKKWNKEISMSIVDKLKRAAELGAPISINEHEQYRVLMRDGVEVIIDPENLDASTEWIVIGALTDYLAKHYEPNQLNVELNASVHYGYSALIDGIGLHAETEHDTSLLEATLDAFIEAVEGGNEEGES